MFGSSLCVGVYVPTPLLDFVIAFCFVLPAINHLRYRWVTKLEVNEGATNRVPTVT